MSAQKDITYGRSIYPAFKDKYYVYALCKPNGIPFYIGKGTGSRINHHFKKSALLNNTPKTGKIKKYKDKVKREILCYFDLEEAAYEYEEWLISVYGLESEGGFLTNYAKTRFQYSEKFYEDFSAKGYKSRKNKFSEDIIVEIYRMFYTYCLSLEEISNAYGIDSNYLGYVLRGAKRKDLYKQYVCSGYIVNSLNYTIEAISEGLDKEDYIPKHFKNDIDVDYHSLYEYYRFNILTLSDLCDYTGFSEIKIIKNFEKSTKHCKSIVESFNEKYGNLDFRSKGLKSVENLYIKSKLSKDGYRSVKGLAPKTTIYRAAKYTVDDRYIHHVLQLLIDNPSLSKYFRLVSYEDLLTELQSPRMAAGGLNGTSSGASEIDNSIANVENT